MKNLSGAWKQVGGAPADAGTYYFRQVELNGFTNIFWHGHQTGGDAWDNAAFGRVLSGKMIMHWADTTDGTNRGFGVLEIKQTDDNTIEWVKQISGMYFGGRKWVRTPVSFTVASAQSWQKTPVVVQKGDTVKYQSGQWTANPSTGMVNAAGNSRFSAKPGYTMPGQNEGALIGRLAYLSGGTSAPFLVGMGCTITDEKAGYLELCINDDLSREYGSGLADNQGSVTIGIN